MHGGMPCWCRTELVCVLGTVPGVCGCGFSLDPEGISHAVTASLRGPAVECRHEVDSGVSSTQATVSAATDT